MRSGLRSDWPHNFDSEVTQLEVTVFQYIALSKLHRNDKKKNHYGTFCDISFCPLSDDLFKFLWKWWHKCMTICRISISLIHFVPFSSKNIFVSAEKPKHLHVIQVLINILETGQWNLGVGPMPLFWVTHHKTNYGVGKLKSLWGGHGKNGNILSTPKEIPINIPSHIIPRSSALGRHHIILLANHHSATLFLES